MLFQKGKIPHTLLFTGPERIGKKKTAEWFLQLINCHKANPPCGKCESCKDFSKGIHPDIIQISPQGKEICLEQVDALREKISFKAIKSSYKGAIIDEAHLLNTQAQHSLLKTLEEPPLNTIIILVSEHPYLLLPTILSRSFELKFSIVPEKEIASSLNDSSIAALCLGRPGVALEYLHFPDKKEKEEKTIKILGKIKTDNLAERFAKAQKIAKEENVREILSLWIKYMREQLRDKIKAQEKAQELCESIKEIEETMLLISKTNINIQLALEKIMIKL